MAVFLQIGIILLAAGGSTRMGRPKQLLPYRGSTLLRHAVDTAIATGFAPIVVVLGAEAERCRAEIAGLSVHAVVNPEWERGMGTSLRVGVGVLRREAPGVAAVLIMLHDQPMITAAKLCEMAARWTPASCAVASTYAGTLGVPALLARELFDELSVLDGNQGARRILEAHRSRLVSVAMPEALHDMDTPADYDRLK